MAKLLSLHIIVTHNLSLHVVSLFWKQGQGLYVINMSEPFTTCTESILANKHDATYSEFVLGANDLLVYLLLFQTLFAENYFFPWQWSLSFCLVTCSCPTCRALYYILWVLAIEIFDVLYQRADVAALLAISPQREEKIDLTFSYYMDYLVVMYQEQDFTSKVSTTYLIEKCFP